MRKEIFAKTASLIVSLSFLIVPTLSEARLRIVRDGELIQDTVDDAEPGDIIFVGPGTYGGPVGARKYAVSVQKDDITLIGSRRAVIDAAGLEYGVVVGPAQALDPSGCPEIAVEGFRIRGFTVKNAENTGVLLTAVRDYQMVGGRYLDNAEYGPFPICSIDGLISRNFISGHRDAGVYIGDSQNTTATFNIAVNNVVGAEIENSRNTVFRHNWLYDNAGGLLIFVGPNLPQPFNDEIEVSNNFIFNNNRVNDGAGTVALVPEGTGILLFGSDDVNIERNFVIGNDSFGFASIGNFNVAVDPRIEPFNDNVTVRRNIFRNNGASPDPLRALTPGADIIFIPDAINPLDGSVILTDPDPSDNCFADNFFTSQFPEGITELFPCD